MLNDPRHVFVYPSEVAASQQRRGMLSVLPAIDTRRWISWDQCKQFVLQDGDDQEGLPANATARLVFADYLLSSRLVAWKGLLPHEAQPAVFRRFVARALPTVLRLSRRGHEALGGAVGQGTAEDLLKLAAAYQRFLDQSGMFEPSAVFGDIDTRGAVYHLYDTQVIEDYRELELQIRDCPQMIVEPQHAASPPCLEWYPNVKAEMRVLVSRLEALLGSGTPCSDIAVTVADHETVIPYLEREAQLRGVQVTVRTGQPLLETPGASLFRGFAEIAGSGYRSMRNLLLTAAVPFLYPETMHALAAFGRRWRCWGSFGADDLWEDAFSRALKLEEPQQAGETESLRRAYRALREAARGLGAAGSMRQLRRVFFSWYDDWIDADGWDPATEREFQTCLELLAELVRVERQLDITVSQPMKVLLELLGDKLYMQAGGTGIPVYPYRVTAGGTVPHHFLANLHQDAIEVLSGGVPFLREDQLEAAGIQIHDMTEDFLRTCFRCGEQVVFSGNAGIRGSVHGIPSFYLTGGSVVYKEAGIGIEEQERRWWRNPESALPHLPERLAAGTQAVRHETTGHGLDMTRSALTTTGQQSDSLQQLLRRELVQRYGTPAGWKASAGSLAQMTAGPGVFLLNRVLRLEEADWEPSWSTAMDVGNIYHHALELLLCPDGPAAVTDATSIGAAVEAVVRDLGGYVRLRTALCRLEQGYELCTLRQVLQELLPVIGPWSIQARVDAVELGFSQPDPEFGIVWEGRIDRLDRIPADGRVVIWDYKRKSVPSRKQFEPHRLDDTEPHPVVAQPQMAVYLRWAQLNGLETAAVRYVGLQKNAPVEKRITNVQLSDDLQREMKVSSRYLSEAYHEEGLPQLWAALQYQTREYVRRLEELDFSMDRSCTRYSKNPSFRQVLRHRYNVR